MELASDSSGEMFGAIVYDKSGNIYFIQEEWASLGIDAISHPRLYDNIHDKVMIAHIAMIGFILPLVGGCCSQISTKIDNTSAQSWINKLYAPIKDSFGDEDLQLLRSNYIHKFAVVQLQRSINLSLEGKSSQRIRVSASWVADPISP